MTDLARPESELILYQTEDGRTRIECRFEGETLWLTQALIAELFRTSRCSTYRAPSLASYPDNVSESFFMNESVNRITLRNVGTLDAMKSFEGGPTSKSLAQSIASRAFKAGFGLAGRGGVCGRVVAGSASTLTR